MQLVCSVELSNRLAIANGIRQRQKSSKSVLQLKRTSCGKPILLVSSNKDLTPSPYLLANISIIRKDFIQDGKITIELRNPEINLMLSNAQEEDLIKLLEKIRVVQAGGKLDAESEASKIDEARKSSTSASEKKVDKQISKEAKVKRNSKRANTLENFLIKGSNPGCYAVSDNHQAKRAKLTNELVDLPLNTKRNKTKATTAIRTALKTNSVELNVRKREDYPLNGFSGKLKRASLNSLGLSKVDSRLLDLKNLTILNLSDNKISSIDCLQTMDSCLKELVLDKNSIGHISEDLFCSSVFKQLTLLSLCSNQLVKFPRSIVKLDRVQVFRVPQNKLASLPYGMHGMKSLKRLDLSDNKLTTLPFPIALLGLVKLDISNNDFFKHGKAEDVLKLGRGNLSRNFPTLFELTASSIRTYNQSNRHQESKQIKYNVENGDITRVAYEMLESCNLCVDCQLVTPRFVSDYGIPPRALAEEVVSNIYADRIPLQKVICEYCIDRTPSERINRRLSLTL